MMGAGFLTHGVGGSAAPLAKDKPPGVGLDLGMRVHPLQFYRHIPRLPGSAGRAERQ